MIIPTPREEAADTIHTGGLSLDDRLLHHLLGCERAGFFKFSLLGPPSTEVDWYVPAYWNTANVELDHETSAQAATKTAYTYGTPAANQAALTIHGMIYPGTAGPMGLYWSQGTSNATGTRVWNGSRLTLTRVS